MDKFFKHPWMIVGIIAAVTVFFAFQLPKAEMDNDNIRFVPKNDPARVVSEEIDDEFGSSSFILVSLEREYGTVFDAAFLRRVREYTDYIDTECEIVGDINSIMTTDYITGVGDSIVVENLVPDSFEGTPEEIAELRQRLRSWDLYERSLVSDDFTATQILIPLDIESEDSGTPLVSNTFKTIRDSAHEMFDGMATVYVAGLPVVASEINEAAEADLSRLVPLVFLVVLVILFFSFHNITAVLLPLITVLVAVVWTIGAMPLVGIKLSVLSTIIPVVLVAVGSAYGIHVVTHYIEDIGGGGRTLSADEHRQLVFSLLRRIGKPVALAALTTFAGFVSFCFTTVPPIREWGYLASFGVVVSFTVAVTLIPALLLIRGPRPIAPKKQKRAKNTTKDTFDYAVAESLTGIAKRKRFVLTLTAVVTVVSVYGITKVVIDNVFVEYFNPQSDVRLSDVFVRERFGGSKVVNVVVEADDSATLLSPEVLGAVDGLHRYLEERVPDVGKVTGFTDLVKRTNQVFNVGESPEGIQTRNETNLTNNDDAFGFGDFGIEEEGPRIAQIDADDDSSISGNPRNQRTYSSEDMIAILDQAAASSKISAADLVWQAKRLTNYEGASYYEIPADPARYGKTESAELSSLVSNYLVLLSGSAGDYANDPLEPTAIRSTVQLRTTGDADTKAAVAKIRSYIDANFPDNVRVKIGGTALVESALSGLVVQSQVISVAVSVLMVFIIIALSNKSLTAGLVGSVPLLISILIDFAVMGFAGIKLNLGTSLVASLAVGIGIDYTVHFIDAYKREYLTSDGGEGFLYRAFATSGKAIIINAVSVGAGFAVLTLSRFTILADLGLLIALTMFTSALISLTVIPVLLSVLKPKFIYGGK